MATQSAVPQNPTEEKPQNTVSEVAQPTIKDREDPKAETTKENSPTPVFVNSEPIREEQVQNAVKFLSHPKVRGSPVIYRRSFLERKGLTKEEIDEAFRRVPDPPSAVSTTQPVTTSQVRLSAFLPLLMTDAQLKSTSNTQLQGPTAAPPPSSAISNVGVLAQSRFHWSQALLAVGLLSISGAGTVVIFKNAVVPRLKSWIRKVVLEEEDLMMESKSKPSLAEEAAAAAKAAAASAADVAQASQEMLISKIEERRYFGELMNLLNMQIQEMKSMSIAIRKLEGQRTIPVQDNRVSGLSSSPSDANGNTELDLNSGYISPPASVEPAVAPHPKSYMEIMAMIQRGEKPSNIREINDQPPNPNQPVSNPRLTPRPKIAVHHLKEIEKPWEVGQSQNSSSPFVRSQENGNSLVSMYQDDGRTNQLNRDTTLPLWQQQNVRITEIESEDENRTGSSFVPPANERPIQRSWVPPQPPPVAMPEAAAAIRQPKKPLFQKEQLTDDQVLSRPSEISDDLQRITKESEFGGVMEANGESSVGVDTSEIQKEDNSYLET
ncbi:hypothetical protein LguiA_009495 [Lonicera macranthoides]